MFCCSPGAVRSSYIHDYSPLTSCTEHDAFSDAPWIVSLTRYIADIFQQTQKPIIGICFGHQIVARALGARVGRSTAGWEVAVDSVTLNETGKELFGKDTLVNIPPNWMATC